MLKDFHSFEYKHSTNLGDEIQTIAAINLLKKLNLNFKGVVDRNTINTEREINLLVNGFFQVVNLKNLFKKMSTVFSQTFILTKSHKTFIRILLKNLKNMSQSAVEIYQQKSS